MICSQCATSCFCYLAEYFILCHVGHTARTGRHTAEHGAPKSSTARTSAQQNSKSFAQTDPAKQCCQMQRRRTGEIAPIEKGHLFCASPAFSIRRSPPFSFACFVGTRDSRSNSTTKRSYCDQAATCQWRPTLVIVSQIGAFDGASPVLGSTTSTSPLARCLVGNVLRWNERTGWRLARRAGQDPATPWSPTSSAGAQRLVRRRIEMLRDGGG